MINSGCCESGHGMDYRVPQRIFCTTTIFHRKPMLADIRVLLIGQSLGF